MNKAIEFNHAVNFGGGAAQRPITPFSGGGGAPHCSNARPAMQSYNLSNFSDAVYLERLFRPAG